MPVNMLSFQEYAALRQFLTDQNARQLSARLSYEEVAVEATTGIKHTVTVNNVRKALKDLGLKLHPVRKKMTRRRRSVDPAAAAGQPSLVEQIRRLNTAVAHLQQQFNIPVSVYLPPGPPVSEAAPPPVPPPPPAKPADYVPLHRTY